jgi:hypothetical protein
MITKISRRHLLAGAAAVPLTGLAAVPVAANAADHPDAELLELGRKCREITAAIDQACKISDELYRRYLESEPAPPEALRVRPEDQAEFGFPPPDRYCEPGFYTEKIVIDKIRWPRTRYVDLPIYPVRHVDRHPKAGEPIGQLPADHHAQRKREPWPEAQARADEIVAAWDRWKGECKALLNEVGYTDADDEVDRLYEMLEPLHDELVAARAMTLEGVYEKVAAISWCHSGEPLELEVTQSMSTSERLAWSIARDLQARSLS